MNCPRMNATYNQPKEMPPNFLGAFIRVFFNYHCCQHVNAVVVKWAQRMDRPWDAAAQLHYRSNFALLQFVVSQRLSKE